jgi:hypothetical protein
MMPQRWWPELRVSEINPVCQANPLPEAVGNLWHPTFEQSYIQICQH